MSQLFCGIDIGASTVKLAIIDPECGIVSKAMRRSGVDYAGAADALLEEALDAEDDKPNGISCHWVI